MRSYVGVGAPEVLPDAFDVAAAETAVEAVAGRPRLEILVELGGARPPAGLRDALLDGQRQPRQEQDLGHDLKDHFFADSKARQVSTHFFSSRSAFRRPALALARSRIDNRHRSKDQRSQFKLRHLNIYLLTRICDARNAARTPLPFPETVRADQRILQPS